MSAPDAPQPPYWQPDPYAGQQTGAPQWQSPPPPPPPARKRSGVPLWAKIAIGVVAAFILLGIGIAAGGGPAKVETKTVAGPRSTVTATATVNTVATVTATPPAPTATVTTTFTPQPKVAFTDGQFLVPSEVQPGNYHTDGGGGCYYELLRDLNGSINSIINNDNFDGPTTIQVGSGVAAIKTDGGCAWSKVG